jgi:3-deoxy-manno-octulosonate cytidylyltransferase (CMP-KDO synthetase)
MATGFHVIVPARHGSSRLPGKPLLLIDGKPMVLHVRDAAVASGAQSVTVATDDARIQAAVREAGGIAVMTGMDHQSGSDRIAEACGLLQLPDEAIVVNVQGDEPEMPPELIRQVADLLAGAEDAQMATLCTPLTGRDEFLDPAAVKVVLDRNGRAIYFSRALIPWTRSANQSTLEQDAWRGGLRHLGIYAYRSGYIRRFSARGPCPLEERERLEQLRALWHGEQIACAVARIAPPAGIDTLQDLERARRRLED